MTVDDKQSQIIDRTEEICDVVDSVRKNYEETFEKYAEEITEAMHHWFEKREISQDLRHALLSYANTIAEDLSLDLAVCLALYESSDYDSSLATKTTEETG